MSASVAQALRAACDDADLTVADAILQQCAEVCVEDGVTPEDLIARLDSALLNSGETSVTSGLVASLRGELRKAAAAKRTRPGSRAKRALVHPSPASTPHFDKGSIKQMTGIGDSASFESTFNVKVAAVTPGSAGGAGGPVAAGVKRGGSREMTSPPSAKRRTAGGVRIGSTPPSSTSSGPRYADRTNSGRVELDYNKRLEPALDGLSTTAVALAREIKPLPPALDVNVPEHYRFMFTSMFQRAEALEGHLLAMQSHMAAAYDLPKPSPIGQASQDPVVCYGRICCDAEGKINPASVLLEGSRRSSNGARVPLDLREANKFTLFPGQVVAVRGVNSTGTKLVAKEIWEGSMAPPLTSTPADMLKLASAGPTRIWAASGPYCPHDDLDYMPLKELLAEAAGADDVPQAIVLMGPFVDSSHPSCKSGEIEMVDPETGKPYPVSYDELFSERVEQILVRYLMEPTLARTQVVLVPSVEDAHLFPVYPQAPMPAFGFKFLDEAERASVSRRVTMMSNPGTFTIGSTVVSVNTNDVLRHLAGDVAARHPAPVPNLFERLCRVTLQQRSHYPLFPPPRGAQVELSRMRQISMPVSPDVMIVGSRLTHFARNVDGVLCVNPGRLTRVNGGGTYSKLVINPMTKEMISGAVEEVQKQVAERAAKKAAAAAAKAAEEAADLSAAAGGASAAAGAASGVPASAGSGDVDTGKSLAAEDIRIPHRVADRARVQIVRI